MTKTTDALPDYLRKGLHSPRLQSLHTSTTRVVALHHETSTPFYKEHAVSVYEEGLRKSAIYTNSIPDVNRMDESMASFGWCGDYPRVHSSWAFFLEFQSRKFYLSLLTCDVINHIAYTPAPDIVHEAAGHAPILCDNDYSEYLSDYAKIGLKAIYSSEDSKLFNAIRLLSDIKEKHGSTKEIAAAGKKLEEAKNSFTYVSEATLFARMSWWTAEYGLVGTPDNFKIYGAGLLSSIEEGRIAITDKVKKIPLSLECSNYTYNITEPQPQLFVARDMPHLHEVLDSVESTMSYKRGGAYGLDKKRPRQQRLVYRNEAINFWNS